MLTLEQQVLERIKKSQNILITFNDRWNGDAVASALALHLFLKKIGKQSEIVADKRDKGEAFNFLPHYEEIGRELESLRKFIITLDITDKEIEKVKYRKEDGFLEFIIYPKEGFFTHENIASRSGEFKYDLIITLDTPEIETLGKIYEKDAEFFYKVPIINIDHHSSNEEYGHINKIELTAIATSEIIFNILHEQHKADIDENIATCLLAGIISKTKNYKTQNITPNALTASSQLISMGARREQIVSRLYRSRTINVLKLWGKVLSRLRNSEDGKLVWSKITAADFKETGTTDDDLHEVIDELIINIPQSKVVVIAYEKEKEEKISARAIIYTMKNINALELASKWHPRGSREYARVLLGKEPERTEADLISHIKDELARIAS